MNYYESVVDERSAKPPADGQRAAVSRPRHGSLLRRRRSVHGRLADASRELGGEGQGAGGVAGGPSRDGAGPTRCATRVEQAVHAPRLCLSARGEVQGHRRRLFGGQFRVRRALAGRRCDCVDGEDTMANRGRQTLALLLASERPSAPARSRCPTERQSKPRRCDIFRRSCAWTRRARQGTRSRPPTTSRKSSRVRESPSRCSRWNRIGRMSSRGSRATAASGRCAHGAHRHRQCRSREVATSAVQRRARGRAHLRPRHRRRQGQRHGGADDDADSEAQSRARSTAT